MAVAMSLLLLVVSFDAMNFARVVGFMNKKGIRSIRTEATSDTFVNVSDDKAPASSVATASKRTSRNAPSEQAVSDAVATRIGTEIQLPPFSRKKHAFEDVYRTDIATKSDEYMVYH